MKRWLVENNLAQNIVNSHVNVNPTAKNNLKGAVRGALSVDSVIEEMKKFR